MTVREWWLFRCAVMREQTAREYLEGLGYLCLAPMQTRWRARSRYARGSGAKVPYRVPLMPGYLVVGFLEDGPGWEAIMCERERGRSWADRERGLASPANDLGIRPMVWGEAPVAVRDIDARIMAALEEDDRLAAPEYHRHQVSGREFDPGDRVEVIRGPFIYWKCRVERVEGGRAFIRFDDATLGTGPVEINAGSLVKIA